MERAIKKAYGSFGSFQDTFNTSASGHFASGWAWLVQTEDGSVTVRDQHNIYTGVPNVWNHRVPETYTGGGEGGECNGGVISV